MTDKQKQTILERLRDACEYDQHFEFQSAPSGEYEEYNHGAILAENNVQIWCEVCDIMGLVDEANEILLEFYDYDEE